jgi:hypothetical protein
MMTAEQRYDQLVRMAQDDPAILGMIVLGGRGKGMVNQYSDYDIAVIVQEQHCDAYRARLHAEYPKAAGFDLLVFSLDEFRNYAAWGTTDAGHRYAYAGVRATIDNTDGILQRLIDEKGVVPEDQAHQFIADSLDWYINQVYRSLKCLRAGNMVGFRLEASESIRPLLQAMFCFHERRLLPYYKYLERELDTIPLGHFPWSDHEFIAKLLKILEDGDYAIQQELLREIRRIFRAAGYGEVFDAWEGDDEWTISFVPDK